MEPLVSVRPQKSCLVVSTWEVPRVLIATLVADGTLLLATSGDPRRLCYLFGLSASTPPATPTPSPSRPSATR